MHCTIAQQLLRHLDSDECEEYAIEITGHINAGFIDQMSPTDEDDATATTPTPASTACDPTASAGTFLELQLIDAATSPSCVRAITRRCWAELLGQGETLSQIIELELLAGKQAMAASAYDSAIRLFEAALKLVQWKIGEKSPQKLAEEGARKSSKGAAALLTVDIQATDSIHTTGGPTSQEVTRQLVLVSSACWRSSYATCFRCYQSLASCYFLSSEYVAAQQTIEYVLSQVTDINDRGLVFDLHIQSMNQQNKMQGQPPAGAERGARLGPWVGTVCSCASP